MSINNCCTCLCDVNCNYKKAENGFEFKITSNDKEKAKALKNIADGFKQLNCCDSDCFERCNCSDCCD